MARLTRIILLLVIVVLTGGAFPFGVQRASMAEAAAIAPLSPLQAEPEAVPVSATCSAEPEANGMRWSPYDPALTAQLAALMGLEDFPTNWSEVGTGMNFYPSPESSEATYWASYHAPSPLVAPTLVMALLQVTVAEERLAPIAVREAGKSRLTSPLQPAVVGGDGEDGVATLEGASAAVMPTIMDGPWAGDDSQWTYTSYGWFGLESMGWTYQVDNVAVSLHLQSLGSYPNLQSDLLELGQRVEARLPPVVEGHCGSTSPPITA